MQLFTNSAFLQALGYAIAHSLWQMAIIWAICTAINNFLQTKANIKYTTAVVAQIVGFIWFGFTFQYYYFQCTEAIKTTGLLIGSSEINFILANNNNSFNAYLISFFLQTEKLLPYLSIAYLLVFITLSFKWAYCYNYAQTLRTKGIQKIDVDWKVFVKQTAAYLGIKKEVHIFLSEHVTTPLTIGFLKPVILVPLASINCLTTEQMEAVLLHELAHIKRMDYLLNIVLSIIETILFFNPFTQLISSIIKKEREHSCDDWVLQFEYNATNYASALLQIAVLQNTPTVAMTAVNKKNDLLSRVRRIVNVQNNRFNYRNQLISLLLITVVLLSMPWLVPQQKGLGTAANSIKPKSASLLLEPMAVKVNNPLFNPMFFFRKPLQEEIRKNIAEAEIEIAKNNTQIEQTAAQVKAVAPMVIQSFEAIDVNEQDEQVNSTVNFKKTESSVNINEKQFTEGIQLIDEATQKAKIEADKQQYAFIKKGVVQLQDEINAAMKQFDQLQFSFKNNHHLIDEINSNLLSKEATRKMMRKTLVTAKSIVDKNKKIIDSLKVFEEKRKGLFSRFNQQNIGEHYVQQPNVIPGFAYALNTNSEAPPVITTTTINNEEVTFITIRAKHTDTTSTAFTPKRYEVVVSNTGKPDKKIIIEVLK